MKSILGLGDPTSTATSYSFTCPPSTLLFGFTSSKCTLPGVINGDSVADRPAAVFCHFDFSCTVQPDNITPSYTPVWSPVMGSDPPSSASPVSYNALSCNQGSFVTSMTISNSNLVYSTDGSVSFVGTSLHLTILYVTIIATRSPQSFLKYFSSFHPASLHLKSSTTLVNSFSTLQIGPKECTKRHLPQRCKISRGGGVD